MMKPIRLLHFLPGLALALSFSSAWAQAPGAATAPATPGLPLPGAMIRLSIPDVRAFDAALGGGFRKALYGTLPEDDGVARGFAQSQVGAKLHDQWNRFHGDAALSFQTVLDLQASSAALAVLNIGHMEMVLVLETPLAILPDLFADGTSRIDHGRTYHLVRTGAADEGAEAETRMGLAWARDRGLLVITTSERAMKLSLAAWAAGERFTPKLAGLAGLELDLDALKDDLYFKRDFLFGALSASESHGRLSAALRLESGRLVELREGAAATTEKRGAVFESRDAVASGWIGDASTLLAELRRGVLEPIPAPSLRPQVAIAALPSSKAASAEDRYATSIDVPAISKGGPSGEAAEIEGWKALLAAQPVPGFGYLETPSHANLLLLPWPKGKDGDLAALLEATLSRRGACLAAPRSGGDSHEYVFGPGLPALAFKRMGDFIWIAPQAADLMSAPAVSWSNEVVRFSKLNLAAVREEGRRWARVEGPRSSESVRPLADRVLGLLGWMPATRTLEVERRVAASGFKERIVFGVAPPAVPAPSPSPAVK